MLHLLNISILTGAVLVAAAIFSSLAARRFGAPLLLIFLLVGLVAGEDGLGLEFDNADLAYSIGTVALAIILFDSGFGTRLSTIRQAALPAFVLATVGVLLTAGLTALAAAFLFGFGWLEALLLGAIVSSTDAAAVFFLLRVGGIRLRERVRSTLEIESGSNDPMAVFLTVTLVELIGARSGLADATGALLGAFVLQMGLGLVLGALGGVLLVRIINRLDMDPGLYPILALAAALVLFALTSLLGGSGFLAVYVAGLYAGNKRLKNLASLQRFQEGMTWLAQIVMFLVLGLLATPSEFPAIVLPAIALAVFLIFVARPVAVWLCLLPFRFPRSESAFVAWVGLRGAVSILLAILPLAEAIPDGQLYFNVAFVMVLVSLVVQGWTIRPMAKRLGLIVPPRIGPVDKVELDLPGRSTHELVVYHVAADSPVARGGRIPRWARPSLVVRKGQSHRYAYAGRVEPGDHVYIFAAPRYVPLLDRLFANPATLDPEDEHFFGAFFVDPQHTVGELQMAYGADPGAAPPSTPIGQFIAERLGGRAEIGDRVSCGTIDLIVREIDPDGRPTGVGIVIEPEPEEGLARSPLLRNLVEIAAMVRQRIRR
ncbi:potassium/proton antiporter [Propylenella binzhouense]|uniref:Potassium/proton antiporter n=1 Tax=Propylenella binzhouense TaxID=2555902 RepID=A0A964T7S3_9HYPH|nr:potassium/proton antiporter [Propylenella binzhouense]MYZ49630.1 potassium/proton antiporter [Propylenella binzhouense]